MRRHNSELAFAMSRATSPQSPNIPFVPTLKSQAWRATPQSDGSSYHPSPSLAPKQKKTPASLKRTPIQQDLISASTTSTAAVVKPSQVQQYQQRPGEKKKYTRKASVRKEPYDNYGDKLFGPYGSSIKLPPKQKRKSNAGPNISTSRGTSAQASVPENDSLPGQKGTWSTAEDDLCIQLMTHYVDTRATHKIPIEHMWAHVAADMAKEGFPRTGLGVKMQWTRRLRDQSGVDERAKPNPAHMKTGLLKREKGSHPRVVRAKVEKKIKKERVKKEKSEKVKTGRVKKTKGAASMAAAGDPLTKLGRPRKVKKIEERKAELSVSPATDVEGAGVAKETEGETVEEAGVARETETETVDEDMALVVAYNGQHEDSDDDDYAEQFALDEDERGFHMTSFHQEKPGAAEDEMDMMGQMQDIDVEGRIDTGYNTHDSRQSSYFEEAFEAMDTYMG
jgi:hypothetical protein